jgi:hypothetical protein
MRQWEVLQLELVFRAGFRVKCALLAYLFSTYATILRWWYSAHPADFFWPRGNSRGRFFRVPDAWPTRLGPSACAGVFFFAAAILWPSRRIFFWPLEAGGDFIVFKNAILIRLMTGAIFSGKNLATIGFSSHP